MSTLTTEQIRETCETYVSLVGSEDIDAMVALFTEDGRIEDPVGSEAHVGHEAIRAFYATLPPMGVSATLTGPVHAVADAATAAFPFEVHTGDMVMQVIDVMTFDADGRIATMTAYWKM